jgi:hypothetical protein
VIQGSIPGLWKHLAYFDVSLKESEPCDELLLQKLRVRIGLNAVTDVVIVLSFGTFFPPLTWLLLGSMFKDLLMYRLLLHRWKPWLNKNELTIARVRAADMSLNATDHTDGTNYDACQWLLKDKRFEGLLDEVVDGLWMAVIVSVLIWCLVLFDIIGNKIGIAPGNIAIVIVLGTSPFLIWVIKFFTFKQLQLQSAKNELEMKEMKLQAANGGTMNPMMRTNSSASDEGIDSIHE